MLSENTLKPPQLEIKQRWLCRGLVKTIPAAGAPPLAPNGKLQAQLYSGVVLTPLVFLAVFALPEVHEVIEELAVRKNPPVRKELAGKPKPGYGANVKSPPPYIFGQ